MLRIKSLLSSLRRAVAHADSDAIIRSNYELHSAIASACHNRCIERGYRQMLMDKQRLAQHGLPGTTYDKGQALADRFAEAFAYRGGKATLVVSDTVQVR